MSDASPAIAGLRTGFRRLRFERDLEADYQAAVIEQKRVPRALLFAFLGLCFALAPLYQTPFFDVARGAAAWLTTVELFAVGPLAFLAALATWRGRPRLAVALIQSVAVVILWVSPLFLRYLALHGGLQYPASMVGLVVIAIALFGGFHGWVFGVGAVIVLAVGAVQEVQLAASTDLAWLDVNALVLAGLIAVLGAYAAEIAHRRAWAQGRAADLLTRIDPLTGLANRRELERSLPALLHQARRDRCGLVVAVFALDGDDADGSPPPQPAHDAALGALAGVLRTAVVRRPFDLAARLDAGHLLVLWYGAPPDAAPRLAEALRAALRSLPAVPGRPVCTASIGIRALIPQASDDAATLLRHAQALMDEARREGPDRVRIDADPYP